MTQVLFWRDQPVPVRFSKRKTVALHVRGEGIELRAPYQTPSGFLQQFLNSKSRWLDKTLREQAEKTRDRIQYAMANRIPFMGFNVSVHRHTQSGRPDWTLTPDGLTLRLNDLADDAVNLSLLEDFYRAQAKFWLHKKTQNVVQQAGLQAKLNDIRLRKTKTKWGHCTREGRIQYNWLIMMAPERVIDYLVCHEVSHLRHLNHSAAFWQQVEDLHPTYLQDRQWLRDNEHRLTLSD